ncbi:MAG: hypothetical protein QXD69_06065, partial [Candidatus Bathyarchaeia archaeon]
SVKLFNGAFWDSEESLQLLVRIDLAGPKIIHTAPAYPLLFCMQLPCMHLLKDYNLLRIIKERDPFGLLLGMEMASTYIYEYFYYYGQKQRKNEEKPEAENKYVEIRIRDEDVDEIIRECIPSNEQYLPGLTKMILNSREIGDIVGYTIINRGGGEYSIKLCIDRLEDVKNRLCEKLNSAITVPTPQNIPREEEYSDPLMEWLFRNLKLNYIFQAFQPKLEGVRKLLGLGKLRYCEAGDILVPVFSNIIFLSINKEDEKEIDEIVGRRKSYLKSKVKEIRKEMGPVSLTYWVEPIYLKFKEEMEVIILLENMHPAIGSKFRTINKIYINGVGEELKEEYKNDKALLGSGSKIKLD